MNCTQDYSNEFEELNIFMTTERKREGIVVFLKSHRYTYNMRAHKCICAYRYTVCVLTKPMFQNSANSIQIK